MEGENAQHGEPHAAVVAAMADAEGRRAPQKMAPKIRTTAWPPGAPQYVVPGKRKPGAQPGNRNACKTGYHSAHEKARRRDIDNLLKGARAMVASVNGYVREQKKLAKLAPPPRRLNDP